MLKTNALVVVILLLNFFCVDGFAATIAGWDYEQDVDKFADRKAFTIYRHAKGSIDGLAIYCNPHYNPKTEETDKRLGSYLHVSIVTLDDRLFSDDLYDVQYRIDNGMLERSTWKYENGVAKNNEPAGAVAFVNRLKSANSLRVRLFGKRNYARDIDFDLNGISAAIDKIAQDCEATSLIAPSGTSARFEIPKSIWGIYNDASNAKAYCVRKDVIDPLNPNNPAVDTGMFIDQEEIVWYEMRCKPTSAATDKRGDILIPMICNGEGEEWKSEITIRKVEIHNNSLLLLSERVLTSDDARVSAYDICK